MKKASLRKALKNALLIGALMLCSSATWAQSKISGTIKDATGEPLIGVSVMEIGTNNGTVTDANGNYTLDVKPKAKLKISYVGYATQEITAGSGKSVVLKEDNKMLNEVVVVGYGKMERKDVTSSITTIKSEDLNKGGVYSSPAQLLQGKVPGLVVTTSADPNASPSVTLRGASTFRTGDAQEPYYVIDGIPGASFALVSPDDIESIDILRDASATAIYGSKAANGVIIVTTKHGKKNGAQVSYSGYLAIDNIAKKLDLMSASEHQNYLSTLGKSLNTNDYVVGQTNDTDWQKEVLRTGVSQNHNVSINGGNDKTSYSASINYMKNQGIIRGTDFDRLIGRAVVSTSCFNNLLDVNFSLNGSITNNHTIIEADDGMNVLDAMMYYLPEAPVKNSDGSYFENMTKSQYYNPVALINQNTYNTRNKRLQGIAKATLHILPELTYDINMSYQTETVNYNQYNDIDSKATYNYGGYALRNTVENNKKSLEMYINYNKTFNDFHKVGLMGGYSWQQEENNDGFQTSAKGFSSDALSYYNLGIGNSSDRPNYGSIYYSTMKVISFFGRINYSYDSKYLLQATIRRDGSSAFGKNNRWGTFPSGSFAWRMSEEPFIKNLNVFSDLKFRVGYGVSGNSMGFDPYVARVLYAKQGTFLNSEGIRVSGIGASRNANPDLKWERTSMLNAGFDFGFFNNRLTGTIEYYDKQTTDLIADYTVSATKYLVGWLTANVGQVSNRGVEFSLTAIPVQNNNFTWSTTFNLSHNTNKVKSIQNEDFSKEYFEEGEANAPGQTGLMVQRIASGMPIGSFYLYRWAGYDENGVSVFYTKDGNKTLTPTKDDQVYAGSAQPKFNLGWSNTLNYKNWSMTMFFTGVFGNKILNATRARLSRVAAADERNLLKSVVNTELITDYNSHLISDRYLENGSYFRLKTLSVSYTFPNVSKYVKNIRIYGSCNNVFVITGYKGLDPEVELGGLTPGIDNKRFYPATRTIMFGVNLTL